MNSIFDHSEADFRANPVLFVELARLWAESEVPPETRHEQWLAKMSRPLFKHPTDARTALWGILSTPQRARSLTWVNQHGILAELIPAWQGESARQEQRLHAVDEVHLERWADGLSKTSFEWLCVYQDQQVDGRLGGWALTGLATLLLAGDEPADSFAPRVDADLKTLGAGKGERERVITAIHEHTELFAALIAGIPPTRVFGPTAIVATLSTLLVIPHLTKETLTFASVCADKLMKRFAAPEDGLGTHPRAHKR
jgi:hypothetical protein